MEDNSNKTQLSKSIPRIHHPPFRKSSRHHPCTYLSSFEMYPLEHTKNIPLFQPATEYRKFTNNHSYEKRSCMTAESKRTNISSFKESEADSIGSVFPFSNKLHSTSSNKNFPSRKACLFNKSARSGDLADGKLEKTSGCVSSLKISAVEKINSFNFDSSYTLTDRNIIAKTNSRNLPIVKKVTPHKGYTGLKKKFRKEMSVKSLTSGKVGDKNTDMRWFENVMMVRSMCR